MELSVATFDLLSSPPLETLYRPCTCTKSINTKHMELSAMHVRSHETMRNMSRACTHTTYGGMVVGERIPWHFGLLFAVSRLQTPKRALSGLCPAGHALQTPCKPLGSSVAWRPGQLQPGTQAGRTHCHRGLGKCTTTCRRETSWMGSLCSQESVSLLCLLAAIQDKSCEGNLHSCYLHFCFLLFLLLVIMSTSSHVGVDEMEQENQQGTKRTYAQAIRRTTKTKLPQEITEPAQPQETRRATPPEQAPNED